MKITFKRVTTHKLGFFSSPLKFVNWNLKEKRYLKVVINYEGLGQSAIAVVLQELALGVWQK